MTNSVKSPRREVLTIVADSGNGSDHKLVVPVAIVSQRTVFKDVSVPAKCAHTQSYSVSAHDQPTPVLGITMRVTQKV